MILIHGNPGSAQDWQYVLHDVSGQQVAAINAYEDFDSSLIKENKIVAYSWGAYRLLSKIESVQENTEITLVTPYLEVENKMSVFAGAMIRLPLLSGYIFSNKSKQMTEDFVADVLAGHPRSADLIKELNKPELWKRAALAKLSQQSQTLSWNLINKEIKKKHIKVKIIAAKEDRTSPPENIKRWANLIGVHQDDITWIDGAPHGLLWTHPEVIKNKLF